MKSLTLVSICTFVLAISAAHAAETQQYSSQAAALAALTARSHPAAGKTSTGKTDVIEEEDDDDIQEIPADTPTTSNVQVNVPVAGETGQL
ncbi:MAG: hypothetical protein ACJ763_01360 [Bdellovibrionia bacterium]